MPRNDQPLKELQDELKKFSSFEKDQLISRTEWGTISLEGARQDFDRIYDIINYLKVLPLNLLTVQALTTIKNEIAKINTLFDKINQFSIETGDPAGQRDQFINQVQSHADSLYTQASPWIPFLAYQKGDVSKNIEKLTESLRQAEELISSTKNNISQREKEIEDIIIKAREASAAAGAAVFTEDFRRESEKQRNSAKKWLWVTGGLALLTLSVAIFMWYFTEPGLDKGQLWQKLGTKLAILAVLISGTVWCGKIYKALMHQATVNNHRALSIQTLQAFAAAVEDTAIKDAVLLEATRAVFGNVPTGYVENSPSTSESDIKLFEVAKNILPKSSS